MPATPPSPTPTPDSSAALIPGEWTHRVVRAHGIALHVAELGNGPLVILLHGFPQFWWAWREQLLALAEAGYRAVAVDLRGYGASDKPPRGYDIPNLAADIASLVAALGEPNAMLVGSDVGGMIAWTVAANYPEVVRGLVVAGAAHPLRLRTAIGHDRAQRRASGYALGTMQVPRRPEALLTRDEGWTRELFDRWAGPRWRHSLGYSTEVATYAAAMRIQLVAYCATEYFRWLVRSMPRADGRRFAAGLRSPIGAPVLQLHGGFDSCVLPSTAQGSGQYVAGDYEWRLLDGLGHFAHNEAPESINGELVRWAKRC